MLWKVSQTLDFLDERSYRRNFATMRTSNSSLSRMFPFKIVNNTSIKDVRAQNLLTYRAVFMKSYLRFVDLQEKLQRERLRYVLSAIHERYLMLILRHV